MQCEMKIIIFIVIVIAGVVFIPDTVVGHVVDSLDLAQGDGEEGMNNFFFIILLIKTAFSTVIALLILRRYRKPQ